MNASTDPYRFLRKKVAVVGSGSAGIGALWALNKTYHDVYVYEASDRLGGHTNTVDFTKGKFSTKVDTGFHVLNAQTSPNFIRFLEKLNIKTAPTHLSFSVSRDCGALEWAGSSLTSLFCQRRNLLSPRMWRMLFDIIRFNQFSVDLLSRDEDDISNIEVKSKPTNTIGYDLTIGQYLDQEGYSQAFRDDYLLPLAASLWSTSPDKCAMEFPALTFVRFL
jgi:predicted NAD/FAD-binding protein